MAKEKEIGGKYSVLVSNVKIWNIKQYLCLKRKKTYSDIKKSINEKKYGKKKKSADE